MTDVNVAGYVIKRGERMKWHDTDGIVWGEFPKITNLGVVHGMSTRMGGVSEGGCESLNLGFMADKENPDRTLENRRRFFKALGLPMGSLATFRQVHSDIVHRVEKPGIHDSGADGVITNVPGLALMALAADCVPVLLVDPQTRSLGMVHSGWRGTAQGLVSKAIQKMISEFGSKSKDLWIGIGPSIGVCCYEVNREVYEQTWGSTKDKRKTELEHPRLNLKEVISLQAREQNVPAEQILVSDHCTACESDRFFSHRSGDKGRCGFLASW